MSSASPDTYIVAIGGLDPGGGAGLVRDFLTAEALGATAVLVGTAFTRQSPGGVRGFEPRAPEAVAAAVADALAQAGPRAAGVKVGMVGEPAVAAAIVAALDGFTGPVVYDPVLGASSGGSLFRGMPAQLAPLWSRATLVTPNLAEAAALTGLAVASADEAAAAGRALRAAGATAVLVKGGHLPGAAEDVLVTAAAERRFSAPRLPGPGPRGTGCALATALAVALARGRSLESAVAEAKAWLHARIAAARDVAGERRL
jgi:hydroxymethylpyrimidine/phosphomethylpyrimidine kinase